MVTADLTGLAFAARRQGDRFDVNGFIDHLQQRLGKGGTLVIPSYNFNLRDRDRFSLARTAPITGALASEAMKRGDFIRTKNPLHSFLAWGELAGSLAGLDNRSSFGPGSPFDFFLRHKARMLCIGIPVRNALTFVHFVEEADRVPYRKMKKMRIYLEDEGSWQEYMLYAKKKGWTMEMKGLEGDLSLSGVSRTRTINRVPFHWIMLDEAYPVIQRDIRENRCRGIARFSYKLYFRDVARPLLSALGIRTASEKISHGPGLL